MPLKLNTVIKGYKARKFLHTHRGAYREEYAQHRHQSIEEFVREAMKSCPFKMPVTYECFGKGKRSLKKEEKC